MTTKVQSETVSESTAPVIGYALSFVNQERFLGRARILNGRPGFYVTAAEIGAINSRHATVRLIDKRDVLSSTGFSLDLVLARMRAQQAASQQFH